MKQGVIMDISGNKLKVLTPDGDFLEIKNDNEFNQIGDLVYFEPQAATNLKNNLSSRKGITAKAMLALAVSILLIFSLLPMAMNDSTVYAYVSMDVDSSIELSVSDEMEVLDIEGIDEEGEEMLSALEGWRNQDIAIVVAQILLLMQKEGKLGENNEIVFSTVVLDKDKNLEEHLERKLSTVEEKGIKSVVIETQKATVDDRKKTKNEDVSTDSYIEDQTDKEREKQVDKKEAVPKEESPETPSKKEDKASSDKKSSGQIERQNEHPTDEKKTSPKTPVQKKEKSRNESSSAPVKEKKNQSQGPVKSSSNSVQAKEKKETKRQESQKHLSVHETKQGQPDKRVQQRDSNKKESKERELKKNNDNRSNNQRNDWNKRSHSDQKNEKFRGNGNKENPKGINGKEKKQEDDRGHHGHR